ncbi:MAG: hypothetical protein WCQ87_07585 [Parabacteroides sp.]
MVHEDFKDVTIAERKWRVKKFDALTGCYLAYQIMSQMLPGGLDKKIAGMSKLPEGRAIMGEGEFKSLIIKCLSVCYELLPAGPAPVKRKDGTWGVIGIENDMGTVMALAINAIMFNVQGFFDGSALKDLQSSLADTKLFNAKI